MTFSPTSAACWAIPAWRAWLCGTGLFWVCGAVTKMNFPPWGLNVLRQQSNTQIALLGLWLSLGMMAGAVLAGQVHEVGDLRRVRTYGWGMAALIALLGLVELLAGARIALYRSDEFRRASPGSDRGVGPCGGLGGGRWKVALMLIMTGVLAGLFLSRSTPRSSPNPTAANSARPSPPRTSWTISANWRRA